MALPVNEPLNEVVVTCKTASVGSTPVAAWCVAPVRGKIVRTYGVLEGTITVGAAAIALAINGTAVTGALSLAIGVAGSGASDAPTGTRDVIEGDFISFTPSGATGATIPATFHAVIRK